MDPFVLQNSSQSSLDDGFDRLDGSESRSSKDRPVPHRGEAGTRSTCSYNNLVF